jgi:uncharacterized protein with FMN-binding domain
LLSRAKEHESLIGKLLLSTALVAVTIGYGWWQHNQTDRQQSAAVAAMQMPAAPTGAPAPAQTVGMGAPQTADSHINAGQSGSPGEIEANPPAPPSSGDVAIAKSPRLAMAKTDQKSAPAAPGSETTTPGETVLLPATPPPPVPPLALTGMDAIRAFIPTEGVSPPLPAVTGTPDPDAVPPIPAGTHLEDGDYESEKIAFEWGDLRARIVVTGGKITTVQIMSYPDHRSQSLYLIQLADPILTSEVIKSQQSKVDVVSSATNTSYAFQDAIASAIIKATR